MSRRHNRPGRVHRRMTDAAVWVSITHAATLANVSRQTIHAWLNSGKLKSDHIAGRQVLRRDEVLAHKRAD